MKPECEKRLTVVNGGASDQSARWATGAASVRARGLSRRRSVTTDRAFALARAAGHGGSRNRWGEKMAAGGWRRETSVQPAVEYRPRDRGE
jgi:hypothetical protein